VQRVDSPGQALPVLSWRTEHDVSHSHQFSLERRRAAGGRARCCSGPGACAAGFRDAERGVCRLPAAG